MTRELIKEFAEIVKPFVQKRLLEDNFEGMGEQDKAEFGRDFDEIISLAIKGLESSTWIPVTERLPDDRDWYLGIFKESDTGWINPLPFVCDYVGQKTKATTKEYWILRGFTDRDEKIDYYFNLECVAWMPLPEPYKADKENKDGSNNN